MFALICNLCWIFSAVACFVFGLKAYAFISSLAIGAVAFQFAYTIEHFPTIYGLIRVNPNPKKIAFVIFWQMVIHGVYSCAMYGVGFGVGAFFR